MKRIFEFGAAAIIAVLSLAFFFDQSAAATMEGEVVSYQNFTFENKTYWGKATVTVALPSLKYRLFSLFSEPVYSLHLKFHINRVVLENAQGRSIVIDAESTPLAIFGPDYTTFVRQTGSGHLKVGTEVLKSLRMVDVVINIPMHDTSASIYRKMPGLMGSAGSWSQDVPGSPNWDRLFVRQLTNIWTAVQDLNESDYLSAEDAKTVWKKLVVLSQTQPVVRTFSIGNAVFDVSAFIARIEEIAPDSLAGFFERPEVQKQADALVGAYVGAVESLRDEDGALPDLEAVSRRRNLTVRALNAMRDAGLVDEGTYNSLSRTYWGQALAAVDKRLVALGDEAALALNDDVEDPATIAEPLKARLADLRGEANSIVTNGHLPQGLADRFERLASILDVDCTQFVTAACEPLLELSPPDATVINSPVATITGRVKPEYVAALTDRLALVVGDQEQRVDLKPDGAFSTNAVLASGDNVLRLVLVDQNSETAAGAVLANRTLGYSGLPTRLRVTLTWDTPNSDIDLHVTAPDGTEVYYQNQSSGYLRLDVDSRGYGPENISAEQVGTGVYSVKVVNYSDGVGTTATLNVYKDERLDWRQDHTFSTPKEAWEAGSVTFN